MERDTNSSLLKKGRVLGMALVIAGAILLAVGYFTGLTSSNLFLLLGLFLIVLGAFLHVKREKMEGKY